VPEATTAHQPNFDHFQTHLGVQQRIKVRHSQPLNRLVRTSTRKIKDDGSFKWCKDRVSGCCCFIQEIGYIDFTVFCFSDSSLDCFLDRI